VNKNSIRQSIEQCQHPGEGTHIHVVEQVQPQGMKKTVDKATKYVTTTKSAGKTLPNSTVQQSRERYRLKNTTILIK
jgi:hypothetical protein